MGGRTDSSDEMFSMIPSGSRSRKKQDRDITDRITLIELINKNVCLKQKTG